MLLRRSLIAHRSSLIAHRSSLEQLEPRAMLAGLTPAEYGGAGPVLPGLVAGLTGPSAITLCPASPVLAMASASSPPIMAAGATGSIDSSASGDLSRLSSVGVPASSGDGALPLAVTGSGGILPVLYDASQTGDSSTVVQPSVLTESPLALSDDAPEARIVPLVLHPGSDAQPQIVLTVWNGDGAPLLLVCETGGYEGTAPPRISDGIGNQPTGGALPNAHPAAGVADGELEPKVAAQILAALSRGDLQLALELLAGIGAKGANLAPKFLETIQGLHRIRDGQCEVIASRTAAVFRAIGDSPVIVRIVDSRGSRVWQFGGEIMTTKGFHEATSNAGRIYDQLTGPHGLPLEEYLRLLRTVVGITPEILSK